MYAASDSEEVSSEDKKKRKIDMEKCKELWSKVKESDNAVDFTFVGVTILAAIITMMSSRWYNMYESLFFCLVAFSVLYLLVRALTGRLRILSAEENLKKHKAAGILACAVILLAAGALLCFTEFGLASDHDRSLGFKVIASCAVALGLSNAGLGLVRPTRLSNFIFCMFNAVACALGSLFAWGDYGPRSIAKDWHYHHIFEHDEIFMDFHTTVPLALRLLCPTVIFATTLLTTIMLVFSIISFKRKQQDTKTKKRKMALSKLMVGICGLLLLIVTFNKIWNVSNALFMPGPLDYDYSTQIAVVLCTVLNYHTATLTALMAASYLGMRCSGKLEVMVLIFLAGTTLATDYIALSQYDPDNSLVELDNKLAAFKGCPSDLEEFSSCYYVRKESNRRSKECIPNDNICDGVIDIKTRTMVIQSQECDTVNSTVDGDSYTTTPRYYYDYDEDWIMIAADEAFCRFYYEPYVYGWSMCAFVSVVLCSLVILTAAFIPSYDGIMDKLRGKNQVTNWKTLREEEEKRAPEKKESTEA